MPPPPKPPALRRRRNKVPAAKAPRTLPATPGVKAPRFPLAGALPGTRRWWRTVWASPMAAAWLPADAELVERLAGLVNAIKLGSGTVSPAVYSEARNLEDRLGLSPMARLRLQWLIEPPGAPAEARVDDEERWLRAVGG